MQRRVRVRMRRLARVLREPMVAGGGVGVVAAGVDAGLRASRRLRRRRKAVRMNLLLRLHLWKSACRGSLKDRRLSPARNVHLVRKDVIAEAVAVVGVIAEDAIVVGEILEAGISGWIQFGSGLRHVVRGQLLRTMRLSI